MIDWFKVKKYTEQKSKLPVQGKRVKELLIPKEKHLFSAFTLNFPIIRQSINKQPKNKHMKKVLIPLIAIFAISITANAQDRMGKRGQHQKHQMHQKQMMAKQLNLTEDQKMQAKAINADSRKKMQELNKNENITVKEQRDRKAAIMKDKKAKMDGLLTAEQKAKKTELIAAQKVKKEQQYATRMDKMKTKLDLTDDQVAKLKSQRAANQSKAEKIRNNESLSREQKKEQMMALKADAKAQHNKILTPEQLKKKEEMKKNREGKGRGSAKK